MDILPPELKLIIWQELDLSAKAALNRCSKALHHSTKALLYKAAIKSVHFATKHPSDDVSLAILRNYLESNKNLTARTMHWIPEVSPRGPRGELRRSYQFPMQYDMDILALASAQHRTKIFDFLLKHTEIENMPSLPIQNRSDRISLSSLFVALAHRNEFAAMAILDHCSCIPIRRDRNTALHYAAAANLPLAINRLVDTFKIDINHEDNGGDTPLIYAITSPKSDRLLITQLINKGAIVNKLSTYEGQYISPLSIACNNSRWDLAMEILQKGGDASGKTEVMLDFLSQSHPLRPLSRACFAPINYPRGTEEQRKAVINEMLRQGADPNVSIAYNDKSESLLSHLIRRNRDYEAICLIESPQLLIETTDSEDMTPLERALCTKHGRTKPAQHLLRRGAQIPTHTAEELTALMQSLWRASIPSQIYNLLQTHKKFPQCYQIVYKHFFGMLPGNRNSYMEEFLSGCPGPMALLIQKAGTNKLTDLDILDEMRKHFKLNKNRLRQAARPRTDWWNENSIQRH